MTVVKVGLTDLGDPGREIRKAWLPVATQVLTRDLRKSLGIKNRSGVRVTQLFDEEESTKTLGLKVGDLIIELDGDSIEASEPHDFEVFNTMIRQYRIGSEVELTVLRNGEETHLVGQLPVRPLQAREMQRYKDHDFEFTVRGIAYLDRVNKQLEESMRGVLVDSVQDGGWTSLGSLSIDDVIVAINGKPVRTVDDVRRQMKTIKYDKTSHVIFKVQRGVQIQFIEVEALWEEQTSWIP